MTDYAKKAFPAGTLLPRNETFVASVMSSRPRKLRGIEGWEFLGIRDRVSKVSSMWVSTSKLSSVALLIICTLLT